MVTYHNVYIFIYLSNKNFISLRLRFGVVQAQIYLGLVKLLLLEVLLRTIPTLLYQHPKTSPSRTMLDHLVLYQALRHLGALPLIQMLPVAEAFGTMPPHLPDLIATHLLRLSPIRTRRKLIIKKHKRVI